MLSHIFLMKWLNTFLLICQFLDVADFPLAQSSYEELELIEISQLKLSSSNRFDLSGLAIVDNKVYAVADKGWNNYIYEIINNGENWEISNTIRLGITEVIDIEGIDFCDEKFFLINEFGNKIYSLNKEGQLAPQYIHYKGEDIDEAKWGRNAGLEAIAVNCHEQMVYVAKERQPRFILEIELGTGIIKNQFNIPEKDGNDFADIKYENGYLYVLERGGNLVTKIDVKNQQVVSKVSYEQSAFGSSGRLYAPSKFGMAEALVMTQNEIWIGIDNNGLNTSALAEKKFGINGNQPAILKFKRPKGF